MARQSWNGPSVERNEEFGDLSQGTLIFPQDMEKQFYPEAIKFSVLERQGPSYSKLKGNVESSARQAKDALLAKENKPSAEKTAAANALGAVKAVSNGTRTLVSGAVSSIGSALTEITKLSNEPTVEKHIQSVYLNMPASVVFNEAVGWQGADLGVIGALKSGAGGANALENGLLSGAGGAIGAGLGGALGAIPGISGMASAVVGTVLGSGALQNGIESTFNVKANPYKEQTFQGVDFRSFDFTFTLRARSQSDVDVIQQIIRAFRRYSKPTFEKGTGGAVFSYPKEFKIEFLTIDEDNAYETNEYLPEIKYCVCNTVNTNFSGTGWKSFEGGAPVDISLQLTFQETEIITGEDVMGETEVGRHKDSGRMF
jgi:hypothetical protein